MVKEDSSVHNEIHETVKRQLEGLSTSFHCLATGFGHTVEMKTELDGQDLEHVMEEVSEDLCRSCRRFEECWEQRLDESYSVLSDLLSSGKRAGRLYEDELPIEFLNICHRPLDLMKEMNRCLVSARRKMLLENAMAESRGMVAGQFEEAARIVEGFSEELGDMGELYKVQKKLVSAQMRMLGVRVKQVLMFHKKERGLELRVLAKCRVGRCVTTKEVAEYLGKTLNRRLIPHGDKKHIVGRQYIEYSFCEMANFKVLSGVSRAVKIEGCLSGDSFSILSPQNGSMVMMLSDGMGSGETASKESTMVIEVLEQLLEAGFREEAAVRLVHSLLLLRPNQTMFSTVDMCALNLYTGTCEIIKAGASATYLKREDWVETISSTSLPAGILEHMDYEIKSKKLYDGDYIIMISDGVLDCIAEEDKEGFLQEVIGKLNCNNPQEMADKILKAALACHGYSPVDDMTVLVSGVWKK